MSYDQRNHHPTDLLLLRPIHALTGKNEVKPTNAAFLRRGEHIQVTSGASAKPRAAKKLSGRPPKDLDAARDVRVKSIQNWLGTYPDTPILDLMKEQHLLELGLSNRRGNQNPVHPSKPRSKLIGEYPIVPNLASITDTGGYYSLQINGATNDVHERYDEGLDVAIFRPMELSEIARAEYEAQQQSQGSNGIAPLEPGPEPLQYEMYKPANEETAPIIKKNFDLRSGDLTEDPSEIGGHSGDNRSLHSYLRKARFETDLQHTRVPGTQSLQEIVMVLQRAEDGTTSSQDLQSGSRSALWSRIIQHTSLNEIEGARALGEARSADVPQGADKIELVIREEDEKEKRLRRGALQELEHGTDGSG